MPIDEVIEALRDTIDSLKALGDAVRELAWGWDDEENHPYGLATAPDERRERARKIRQAIVAEAVKE